MAKDAKKNTAKKTTTKTAGTEKVRKPFVERFTVLAEKYNGLFTKLEGKIPADRTDLVTVCGNLKDDFATLKDEIAKLPKDFAVSLGGGRKGFANGDNVTLKEKAAAGLGKLISADDLKKPAIINLIDGKKASIKFASGMTQVFALNQLAKVDAE